MQYMTTTATTTTHCTVCVQQFILALYQWNGNCLQRGWQAWAESVIAEAPTKQQGGRVRGQSIKLHQYYNLYVYQHTWNMCTFIQHIYVHIYMLYIAKYTYCLYWAASCVCGGVSLSISKKSIWYWKIKALPKQYMFPALNALSLW